jgi:O-antigen ligase
MLIWGLSVYRYGGVLAGDVILTGFLLSVTGLVWWLAVRPSPVITLPAAMWIPILLLILYLAFQLLPLPIALLQYISPARAELARGMTPIFGPASWVAITVAPSATRNHAIRVVEYGIVFLLIREAMANSRRHPWLSVFPLIAVGAAEALFGLAQFASGTEVEYAQGTFVNRNHFAGLLAMLLPFAAIAGVNLMTRSRNRNGIAGYAFGAIVAPIMMLAIVQSLSRMGFVAMALSLLAMLFVYSMTELSPRRRWFAVCVVVLGMALSAVLMPTQRVVARLLQTGTEGSSLTRVELWKSALNLWRHYPVFGSGAGSFEFVIPRYEVSPMSYTADFAHNDYLQGLAELGIVGFCVPLCFLVYMLILAIRSVRFANSRAIRSLALACFGALVAILVHSLADFNLYIPSNAMLVSWICGMIAGLAALQQVGEC